MSALARLLLQIVLVIVVARLFGMLARRLRQPSVIGEMAAGIALGPSLFGAIAPATFSAIFPPASLGTLQFLSQIGVILFLFSVGLDFHWHHVRHRARAAVVISNVSIIVPFMLGILTAAVLYGGHAPPGISRTSFALFMGIAMSITAFPVLARILQERRMMTTPIGALALMCAAVNDVIAWTLLAFVVAVVSSAGSPSTVFVMLGLTIAFVLAMVFVVRPSSHRLFDRASADDPFAGGRVAVAFALLFASALATELIGVHALFGAFVAGATLGASEEFRDRLRQQLEAFTSVLLLPLFFVFTGLRTQIGLIGNLEAATICLCVIVVASLGKLGSSAVAARATGLDWNQSFVLGALMNTRGLMELIALNVGYDLGVISPQMFTILVVMALVTTAMTGPLVTLAARRSP